jgi:hypothetical protein
VILWKGNRRRDLQLPSGASEINAIHVYRNAVVLSDPHMKLYASVDEGATWTAYEGGVKVDKAVKVEFSSGEKGYYAYALGDDRTVFYSADLGQTYRAIKLPSQVETVTHVTETQRGLIIGPDFSVLGWSFLYVGGLNGAQWETKKVPGTFCSGLIADAKGTWLRAYCNNTYFESKDMGSTWEKAP